MPAGKPTLMPYEDVFPYGRLLEYNTGTPVPVVLICYFHALPYIMKMQFTL